MTNDRSFNMKQERNQFFLQHDQILPRCLLRHIKELGVSYFNHFLERNGQIKNKKKCIKGEKTITKHLTEWPIYKIFCVRIDSHMKHWNPTRQLAGKLASIDGTKPYKSTFDRPLIYQPLILQLYFITDLSIKQLYFFFWPRIHAIGKIIMITHIKELVISQL